LRECKKAQKSAQEYEKKVLERRRERKVASDVVSKWEELGGTPPVFSYEWQTKDLVGRKDERVRME
jgi:hypothetical protein